MADEENTSEENTSQESEGIELGGNISLTGFKDVDRASMVVIKKIVGSYARQFSDKNEGFEKLSITMKPVHKTEKNQICELHIKVIIKGNPYTAECEDRNLFVALDSVLKKVEKTIS